MSSAAVFLAAASQHTSRIELGTAVIPIGYENPFRLAGEPDARRCPVAAASAAQAGAGRPHLVRGRQPAVGTLGR